MKSEILFKPQLILAGFSFFGDPFQTHAGWTSENEIGRLWDRMMSFHYQKSYEFPDPHVGFEIHLQNHETPKTGEFEVFVGQQINSTSAVPVELCIKILPACDYAVFTVEGENMEEAEARQNEFLMEHGLEMANSFFVQRFDRRFKGLHRLSESVWDVLVPVRTVQK